MNRIPGAGWLALLGGGEFSFGATEDADRGWLAKTGDGTIGFLPAASGSTDYGDHFAVYLDEVFERHVETVPIYRERDARRARNAERLSANAAVYVGGGVTDHLIDALRGTPCLTALRGVLEKGGTLAAIAAGAQSLGVVARSLFGGKILPGLAWLPDGVVETNFETGPRGTGSDRRLRQLLQHEDARWGVGIPAGSAVLLGPAGEIELVGEAWSLNDPEGELERAVPSS